MLGHRGPGGLIRQYLRKQGAQCGDILYWCYPARDAMLQVFGQAARIADDGWQPAGHAFTRSTRQGFPVRRDKPEVASRQYGAGVIQQSGEDDLVLHLQPLDALDNVVRWRVACHYDATALA